MAAEIAFALSRAAAASACCLRCALNRCDISDNSLDGVCGVCAIFDVRQRGNVRSNISQRVHVSHNGSGAKGVHV